MRRVLVIRMGAMGDILHALPAAASLRGSGFHVTWIVKPQFRPLLDGGGAADEILEMRRGSLGGPIESVRELRRRRFDAAVDFQGLVQSAVVARLSRAPRILGFHRSLLREPAAALFYHERVRSAAEHVIERNLDLAAAAGAQRRMLEFPLPQGRPEGELPREPFVLASPFAGWSAKQWPMERWLEMADLVTGELGMPFVFNVAPGQAGRLPEKGPFRIHVSSIPGLIDATRRAAAVVGVDSGPMHLAAALGRPGVAIYGPTDPRRNGPFSPSIRVLRHARARTTYRRGETPDESMLAITAREALAALREVL
ncbi:MAG: glycosyltransferase family 9 protein [Bryobacteraceae bacterium]